MTVFSMSRLQSNGIFFAKGRSKSAKEDEDRETGFESGNINPSGPKRKDGHLI